MAPLSFLEANYLAGNDEVLPAFEVTMKPPRLLFRVATRIGLGGADFGWKLDNRPVAAGQTLEVRPGSTLQGDYCRSGLRGYVAFAGGLKVERWQGSAATHVQSKLGGRIVAKGDEFELAEGGRASARVLRERSYTALYNGNCKVLRVVEGPHQKEFGPEAFSLMTGTVYRVTEQSTRMALRLEGLSLPCPKEAMVSSGAWHGAIQVPPSGIPQIMGVDHPATGGYPILGSVIRADFEVMGQLRPREEVRLGRVSVETARELYRRQKEWWQKLR
jgi:antagonist of KipI